MKLVLIDWLDSHHNRDGWRVLDEDEKPEATVCRSVGWLVAESRDAKTIIPHTAGWRGGEGPNQGCGDITIPSCCILRVVELEAPPPVGQEEGQCAATFRASSAGQAAA